MTSGAGLVYDSHWMKAFLGGSDNTVHTYSCPKKRRLLNPFVHSYKLLFRSSWTLLWL